jgi:hypothetical protein
MKWRSRKQIKAELIRRAWLILLLLFLAQGIYFITANSQTYDEAMHMAAGYSYLSKRDFRLEPQNPPLIKEVLAFPLYINGQLIFNPDPQKWRDGAAYSIGHDFLYRSMLSADRMLVTSRVTNLFLGACLVTLTGWWAYRLWGRLAGVVALALASVDPNMVAHSALVTTDIGLALFIFLAVYLFWEYLCRPKWLLLAAVGVSTGAALVSKFAAILLVPIICMIVVLCLLIGTEVATWLPGRTNKNVAPKRSQAVILLVLVFFLALLMIPPAYFFEGFRIWFSGLMEFMTLAQSGQVRFFQGEHSHLGWWNYFVLAFLIKTPMGTLILIAVSVVLYRSGSPFLFREAAFLLAPVLIVFTAMSLAKVNIELRHVLAVYPFLFVIASRSATIQFGRRWLAPLLVAGIIVFIAVSSLRVAPHQLAYSNEFIGGPGEGYRYLSGSNLDWGQDLKGVKSYMDKKELPIIYLSYFGTAPPAYYGIRYQYVPGTSPLEWPPPTDKVPANAGRKILAISVSNLQNAGTLYDPLFRWLWTRSPIAKIGYSIFVYELTNDPQGLRDLAETYVKAGIAEMR